MGFNPETEVATISVVLTDAGNGNYNAAVTVSSGTNTFTNGGIAYTIAASDFGGLTTFGVSRDAVNHPAGDAVATNDSNVVATVVPEPSSFALCAFLLATSVVGLRRRTGASTP